MQVGSFDTNRKSEDYVNGKRSYQWGYHHKDKFIIEMPTSFLLIYVHAVL